jgi:hypothetical protein
MFERRQSEDENAMFWGFNYLLEKKGFKRFKTFRTPNEETYAFTVGSQSEGAFIYYGMMWAKRSIIEVPYKLLCHADRRRYSILFYLKEDGIFYVFKNIKKILQWGVKSYSKRLRMDVVKFDIALGKKYHFVSEKQSRLDSFV